MSPFAVLGLALRASVRCHLAALVTVCWLWAFGASLSTCLVALLVAVVFTTLETAVEGVLWARRKTRELALMAAVAEIMQGEEPRKGPLN